MGLKGEERHQPTPTQDHNTVQVPDLSGHHFNPPTSRPLANPATENTAGVGGGVCSRPSPQLFGWKKLHFSNMTLAKKKKKISCTVIWSILPPPKVKQPLDLLLPRVKPSKNNLVFLARVEPFVARWTPSTTIKVEQFYIQDIHVTYQILFLTSALYNIIGNPVGITHIPCKDW